LKHFSEPIVTKTQVGVAAAVLGVIVTSGADSESYSSNKMLLLAIDRFCILKQ